MPAAHHEQRSLFGEILLQRVKQFSLLIVHAKFFPDLIQIDEQTPAASEEAAFVALWERVDSNHRRRRRQIYSLIPLSTRAHSQTG